MQQEALLLSPDDWASLFPTVVIVFSINSAISPEKEIKNSKQIAVKLRMFKYFTHPLARLET